MIDYDNDQDGGMNIEISCGICGDTGIKAHGISPETNKTIRIRCDCAKGRRLKLVKNKA